MKQDRRDKGKDKISFMNGVPLRRGAGERRLAAALPLTDALTELGTMTGASAICSPGTPAAFIMAILIVNREPGAVK